MEPLFPSRPRALPDRPHQVTLTENTPQIVSFQATFFTVDATGGSLPDNTGTALRNVTIGSLTESVAQPFELVTGFPSDPDALSSDSFSLSPGSKTSFDLGALGILDITPRAFDGSSFVNDDVDTYFQNAKATFLLHDIPAAVPETSTFVSFGLLLAGLGAAVFTARRRSAV